MGKPYSVNSSSLRFALEFDDFAGTAPAGLQQARRIEAPLYEIENGRICQALGQQKKGMRLSGLSVFVRGRRAAMRLRFRKGITAQGFDSC